MIIEQTNCVQSQVQVDVHRQHAFVTGPLDLEQLRGHMTWDDGTIVSVELAKAPVPKQQHKKCRGNNKNNNSNPFGHGWSKPQASRAATPTRFALTSNEAHDMIEGALRETCSTVDPVSTLLASTAAVCMALSSVELVDKSVDDDVETKSSCQKMEDASTPSPSPPNQSLAALLADYGEQDAEWQQKRPTAIPTPTPQPSTAPSPESLLGQFGHAPIHIIVTSFGYRHGVPGSSCVVDVRPDLDPIPHGLSWMDGTSRAVKGMLLRADARSVAQMVAQRAVDDVLEPAARIHGYASPATLYVHVGSDHGRHRSVVVAELTGTVLRKRLRVRNVPSMLQCPVSVACHHRDVHKPIPANSRKRRDDDEDDKDEKI